MNPVTGWVLTTAGLWLIVGGIAVSEVRRWLRRRREDCRAREAARNSSPADVAQWLIPASERSRP